MDVKSLLDSVKDTGLGGKKKRPKHGFRSTHTEHLDDGSHVVRMQPHEGREISYSAKNTDDLAKKIKQYLGDKSEAPVPGTAPTSEEPAEKA
jgi:hypothetical protein